MYEVNWHQFLKGLKICHSVAHSFGHLSVRDGNELIVAGHNCEMEAVGSGVQSQLWGHSKLEANLGYMRLHDRQQQQKEYKCFNYD